MSEKNRFEYVLALIVRSGSYSSNHKKGALVRADLTLDVESVAELMLSAYDGTIDYDGETIEDAVSEVQGFLKNQEVQPLLHCSWLYIRDGTLASACLVSDWKTNNSALIAYIMTAKEWKGRGFAHLVLRSSLECLRSEGHTAVKAIITEGNIPSEKLFGNIGFVRKEPAVILEA